MPTVAIAIFPGVQALDVAGPVDVFSEANRFIAPADIYEVRLLSADAAPLRSSCRRSGRRGSVTGVSGLVGTGSLCRNGGSCPSGVTAMFLRTYKPRGSA